MNNGVDSWYFSSSQYVQAAVENIETYLKEKAIKPISKGESPLSSNYFPELDVTEELNPVHTVDYQYLIDIFRWMVESGRGRYLR